MVVVDYSKLKFENKDNSIIGVELNQRQENQERPSCSVDMKDVDKNGNPIYKISTILSSSFSFDSASYLQFKDERGTNKYIISINNVLFKDNNNNIINYNNNSNYIALHDDEIKCFLKGKEDDENNKKVEFIKFICMIFDNFLDKDVEQFNMMYDKFSNCSRNEALEASKDWALVKEYKLLNNNEAVCSD